jgi:hypothetical protein
MTTPTHAAVMGDLVRSETATSVEGLHASFNRAVDRVNAAPDLTLASPLTITLGDEFQGLAPGLEGGLAVVRRLAREMWREGLACRFALGAVRVETPVNAARAWNMMGPGLAGTREKLASKRDPNIYRFHLPDAPVVEGLADALGLALTLIEEDWTARQREIVTALIAETAPPPELARKLGLGLRSFYKVRSAARFEAYERQWAALAHAMAALDEQLGLR